MLRLKVNEKHLPPRKAAGYVLDNLCENKKENLENRWEEEVGRLVECSEQPERGFTKCCKAPRAQSWRYIVVLLYSGLTHTYYFVYRAVLLVSFVREF